MAACDLICSTILHERQANASIEQRIKNNSPLLLLLDCINLLPLPRLLTLQSLHFHLQLSPPRHGTLQLFCLLLFAPTKLLFERCIHSRLPTLLQGHFLHHDGLLYLCCSRSSFRLPASSSASSRRSVFLPPFLLGLWPLQISSVPMPLPPRLTSSILATTLSSSHRLFMGIAGKEGSGKSHCALHIASRLYLSQMCSVVYLGCKTLQSSPQTTLVSILHEIQRAFEEAK